MAEGLLFARSSFAQQAPVRNMLQPTMGMKKLLVFDTNLKGRPR